MQGRGKPPKWLYISAALMGVAALISMFSDTRVSGGLLMLAASAALLYRAVKLRKIP